MEPKLLVKYLWLKCDGDNEAILEMIKDKVEITTDIEDKVARFDSQYDSITAIDDIYQEKIQPNLNKYADDLIPPILIRWFRSEPWVKDKILNGFDQNVFILDRDFVRYKLPESINGFGYVYNEETEEYSIFCAHMDKPVLVTKYLVEVRDFAAITCKFLLIGSRCDELNFVFSSNMLDLYLTGGDKYNRVMAMPGKPGCFANKCLKTCPNVMFIDSWADVDEIIQRKEEEEK